MWITAHDLLTGLGMILGYEISRRFYAARRRRRARRAHRGRRDTPAPIGAASHPGPVCSRDNQSHDNHLP